MNQSRKSKSMSFGVTNEEEIANNLHQDILNKINSILHRKSKEEIEANKLKRATVICFDDISINNNDNDIEIQKQIDEFKLKITDTVGDFVDWNPRKTRDLAEIKQFSESPFLSKFVLNKAFNRENSNKKDKNSPAGKTNIKKIMRNIIKGHLNKNNHSENENLEVERKTYSMSNNPVDFKSLLSKNEEYSPRTKQINGLNLNLLLPPTDTTVTDKLLKKIYEKHNLKTTNQPDHIKIKNDDQMSNLKKSKNNLNNFNISNKNSKFNFHSGITTAKKMPINLTKVKFNTYSLLSEIKLPEKMFSKTQHQKFNLNRFNIKPKEASPKKDDSIYAKKNPSSTSTIFLTNIESTASNKRVKFNFNNSIKAPGPIERKINLNSYEKKVETQVKNNEKKPRKNLYIVDLINKKRQEENLKLNKYLTSVNKTKTDKYSFRSYNNYIEKEKKLLEDEKLKSLNAHRRSFKVQFRNSENRLLASTFTNFKRNNKFFDEKNLHHFEEINKPHQDKTSSPNAYESRKPFRSPERDKNNISENYLNTFYSDYMLTNQSNVEQNLKKFAHKIVEKYKKIIGPNIDIDHNLKNLYAVEQDTIGMRYDLLKKIEEKENNHYDYLKDKSLYNKERNNVKAIHVDSNEIIYIDENKANIINHIDAILKMRNENFYKFRNVCVDKYLNYAKKTDLFEYIFDNNRYVPKNNSMKNLNTNLFKLKSIYERMKTTNLGIKKFFEEKKIKKSYKGKNNITK